jgi:hypothetical protein
MVLALTLPQFWIFAVLAYFGISRGLKAEAISAIGITVGFYLYAFLKQLTFGTAQTASSISTPFGYFVPQSGQTSHVLQSLGFILLPAILMAASALGYYYSSPHVQTPGNVFLRLVSLIPALFITLFLVPQFIATLPQQMTTALHFFDTFITFSLNLEFFLEAATFLILFLVFPSAIIWFKELKPRPAAKKA